MSTTAPGTPRRLALVVAGAGVLTAVVGVALWLRHRYVLDDAFISYRYARNLIEGLGPVYNAGERVEGYTNPSWVALSALALALGMDPLLSSQAIGLGCYALAVWLAARMLAPLVERPRDLCVLAALLALGVTAEYVDFAASGLEHGLWGLCVLALGQRLVAAPGARRDASINALCFALMFTRLDGAPFVLVHVAFSARELWSQRRSMRATLTGLVARYGAFALTFGAYLIAKQAYYGSVLPNTLFAKAAGAATLASGISYLRHFLTSYPHLWLGAGLALVGAIAPPRPQLAPFTRWAALSLGLYYAYLVAVGGDFMMYRLALQPYATWMALCGCGLATLVQRRTAVASVCAVALLALAVLFGVAGLLGRPQPDRDFYMQELQEMHRYYRLGRGVGEVLARVLPPDTVIATTLAGTLPYYARLTTIDQLGLNDRWVARHGKHFPRSRGHTRRATTKYLEHRGVNLVFEHPATQPCMHLHSQEHARAYVRVDGSRCVAAEYLVRSPKLTVHMCQHPEWFVLDRIRCPDTTTLHGMQLVGSDVRRSTKAPNRVASDRARLPTPGGKLQAILRGMHSKAPAASTNAAR